MTQSVTALLAGGLGVAAAAAYSWFAIARAGYPFAFSAPWSVDDGPLGRRMRAALARMAVVCAIVLAVAWPYAQVPAPRPPVNVTYHPKIPIPKGHPWAPDLTWLWLSCGVIGLVIACYVGLRLLRSRHLTPEPGAEPQPPADLGVATNDALDALIGEADPRRAVLAAYARMEKAMSHAGLPRRRPETALEFARRSLGGSSLPRLPFDSLTQLFQLAGYSSRFIDEPMRQEAVAALTQIREALG